MVKLIKLIVSHFQIIHTASHRDVTTRSGDSIEQTTCLGRLNQVPNKAVNKPP